MPLTPQHFVSKWERVPAREKQTCREHFIDMGSLVGHQPPNDAHPARLDLAHRLLDGPPAQKVLSEYEPNKTHFVILMRDEGHWLAQRVGFIFPDCLIWLCATQGEQGKKMENATFWLVQDTPDAQPLTLQALWQHDGSACTGGY